MSLIPNGGRKSPIILGVLRVLEWIRTIWRNNTRVFLPFREMPAGHKVGVVPTACEKGRDQAEQAYI
jgi:hypothetical protein